MVLRDQLAPVGMVIETSIDGDASGPVPMPTANPILALGLRGTIVPAGLVRWLARPLAHFFHPPVVALVALTWIAADVWLLLNGSAVAGLDQLIAQPLDEIHHFAGFGRIHSCRRFVKEQELGITAQRPGDL